MIGLCNHYGADIFEKENIKPYMKEIRTLIDKFEIERKINYKKFRIGVIEAIDKYTRKESHLKLIELGVELFNIKNYDEDFYIEANEILNEVERKVWEYINSEIDNY